MSSDLALSEVTYTSISSHGDPLAWAVDLFEAAPASPNYVPDPEEPEQAPPLPDYVPGPEYPGYLAPADDEIVAEDQPYADYASPIALSPGYVADSDPKEDPEEDSKDGLVDYPADEGHDDDDYDSSDDEEEKEVSEEEEEHLAPADSVIAPTVDLVPSSEETEPFETDESAATPPPPPADHTTPLGARISIRPQEPIPFPSEAEVERLLALPTPPPSPLISLSPPSAEERLARYLAAPALPSLPLPKVPHPYALPSLLYLPPLVPTSLPLPSPPLPPLPVSLFIAPPVNRREDIPEAELPPRKRLCLTALTSRFEVGESSTTAARPTGGHRANYGFIGTLDAETRQQEALVSREAWAQSVGLSSAVHHELQAYRNHTQIQDYRIASQESLTVTLVARISLLQGQLSVALRRIQPLQARDPTHADDPEGADTYNHNNIPPKRISIAAARVAAAAARAATPMTIVAIEQMIEAIMSEALAHHETL
ncbi:hypothetical protein Tco_1492295 [Tanacetum coccineum]